MIAGDPVRAFDFWIGSWTVTDAAGGETVGRNRIEAIVGGRALHEHWQGTSGLEGESLNIYDEQRGCWHQTWVSSNGMLLELDGGLRDGAMVMQGGAGDETVHRIRWTPRPDGTVVQRWEQRAPGENEAWELLFEGIYTRA